MRFQDFDELEFARYDDEEIMRRYAEELEEREQEEHKRKKARLQAMLDEHRRRREDEPQWSGDHEDYAKTARDPAEEERIRKSNERIFAFARNVGLASLGVLFGALATSAVVYARDR